LNELIDIWGNINQFSPFPCLNR